MSDTAVAPITSAYWRLLSDLKTTLTCPKCGCIYHDPHMLPCGDTFCLSCIEEWLEKRTACFACKGAYWAKDLKPRAVIKNLIGNYKDLLHWGRDKSQRVKGSVPEPVHLFVEKERPESSEDEEEESEEERKSNTGSRSRNSNSCKRRRNDTDSGDDKSDDDSVNNPGGQRRGRAGSRRQAAGGQQNQNKENQTPNSDNSSTTNGTNKSANTRGKRATTGTKRKSRGSSSLSPSPSTNLNAASPVPPVRLPSFETATHAAAVEVASERDSKHNNSTTSSATTTPNAIANDAAPTTTPIRASPTVALTPVVNTSVCTSPSPPPVAAPNNTKSFNKQALRKNGAAECTVAPTRSSILADLFGREESGLASPSKKQKIVIDEEQLKAIDKQIHSPGKEELLALQRQKLGLQKQLNSGPANSRLSQGAQSIAQLFAAQQQKQTMNSNTVASFRSSSPPSVRALNTTRTSADPTTPPSDSSQSDRQFMKALAGMRKEDIPVDLFAQQLSSVSAPPSQADSPQREGSNDSITKTNGKSAVSEASQPPAPVVSSSSMSQHLLSFPPAAIPSASSFVSSPPPLEQAPLINLYSQLPDNGFTLNSHQPSRYAIKQKPTVIQDSQSSIEIIPSTFAPTQTAPQIRSLASVLNAIQPPVTTNAEPIAAVVNQTTAAVSANNNAAIPPLLIAPLSPAVTDNNSSSLPVIAPASSSANNLIDFSTPAALSFPPLTQHSQHQNHGDTTSTSNNAITSNNAVVNESNSLSLPSIEVSNTPPPPQRSAADAIEIAASTLTQEEMNQIQTLCTAHGKELHKAKCLASPVTHLVIGCDGPLIGKRSIKFLQAIALGLWIVSFDWIRTSIQFGYFVEESPFEIVGDTRNKSSLTYGPRSGRQRRVEGQKHLLTGIKFCIDPRMGLINPADKSQPSQQELASLVQYAGGILLPPPLSLQNEANELAKQANITPTPINYPAAVGSSGSSSGTSSLFQHGGISRLPATATVEGPIYMLVGTDWSKKYNTQQMQTMAQMTGCVPIVHMWLLDCVSEFKLSNIDLNRCDLTQSEKASLRKKLGIVSLTKTNHTTNTNHNNNSNNNNTNKNNNNNNDHSSSSSSSTSAPSLTVSVSAIQPPLAVSALTVAAPSRSEAEEKNGEPTLGTPPLIVAPLSSTTTNNNSAAVLAC